MAVNLSQRDAQILKAKAVTSLKTAYDAFNSATEQGRTTIVLMHLQHSFEMLLKAALVRRRVSIFVDDHGKTKSMQSCLNLSEQHLRLNKDEIGTLRMLELFRDVEQHFHAQVDESLLHIHAQAAVGIFEKLSLDHFDERLADFLPSRVLPLSTLPLENFQTLIDRQYSQVQRMLRKGKRQTTEAKAKLRTLIAMSAHTEGEFFEVTEQQVLAAVQDIRKGASREDVLPSLTTISTDRVGSVDQRVAVKFSKTDPSAIPFRYADDGEDTNALREVDLHSTFKLNRSMLAKRTGLTTPKACALRWKLSIEADSRAYRTWEHADRMMEGYSEVAVMMMKKGLENHDINSIWTDYRGRAGESVTIG